MCAHLPETQKAQNFIFARFTWQDERSGIEWEQAMDAMIEGDTELSVHQQIQLVFFFQIVCLPAILTHRLVIELNSQVDTFGKEHNGTREMANFARDAKHIRRRVLFS